MRRHIILFSISTFFAVTLVAQPSLKKLQATLQSEKQNTAGSYYRIELDAKLPFIGNVFFSPDQRISTASTAAWLKQKMAFRDAMDELKRSKQTDSYFGTAVTRYQQYFKGIRVMYGAVVETAISDKVASLQLEFYSVPDDTRITAPITEQAAFDKALEYVAAEQYVWENNPLNLAEYEHPDGELVIVEDQLVNPGKMCLAYRFDVYATKPLSRQHIFIDAATGNLVLKTSILHHAERGQPAKKHMIAKAPRQFSFFNPITRAAGVNVPLANATGMADTRYSGRRAIITTPSGALGFELLASAIGDNTSIQTLDMSNNTDFSGVNQLYDDDNNWTAAEYSNALYQDAGMEAHWGAGKSGEILVGQAF